MFISPQYFANPHFESKLLQDLQFHRHPLLTPWSKGMSIEAFLAYWNQTLGLNLQACQKPPTLLNLLHCIPINYPTSCIIRRSNCWSIWNIRQFWTLKLSRQSPKNAEIAASTSELSIDQRLPAQSPNSADMGPAPAETSSATTTAITPLKHQ